MVGYELDDDSTSLHRKLLGITESPLKFHLKLFCLGYQAVLSILDLPMFWETLPGLQMQVSAGGGDRRLRRPAGPQVTGSGARRQ